VLAACLVSAGCRDARPEGDTGPPTCEIPEDRLRLATGEPIDVELRGDEEGAALGSDVAALPGASWGIAVGGHSADDPEQSAGLVRIAIDPPAGVCLASECSVVVRGERQSDLLGGAVANAGDVNVDGQVDVVAGASRFTAPEPHADSEGQAVLVTSPFESMSLSEAERVWTGATPNAVFGWAVAGVGDTDGDGTLEVLIGSPYDTTTGVEAGAAYLLATDAPSGPADEVAQAILLGEDEYDQAGFAVEPAGDVDGDGLADVLVTAQQSSVLGLFEGAGYVMLGPVSGTVNLADANGRILGVGNSGQLGWAADGGEDANGDGLDDLVLAGVTSRWYDELAATTYVFFDYRTPDSDGADAMVRGFDPYAHLGDSLTFIPDADGDGRAELALAWNADPDPAVGSVWVFSDLEPGMHDICEMEVVYQGIHEMDWLGYSVDGADLDGDGRGDLVIGAALRDNFEGEEGSALVVLGSW